MSKKKELRKVLVKQLVEKGVPKDAAKEMALQMMPKGKKIPQRTNDINVAPHEDDRKPSENPMMDKLATAGEQSKARKKDEQSDRPLDRQYIEDSVKAIIKTYFTGEGPDIGASIAMSLLMTVLSNVQQKEEMCGYFIHQLEQIRDGGNGGAYQIRGDR